MDPHDLVSDLLKQQALIASELARFDPAKSIDTHTFMYLRDAYAELGRAIRSIKIAHCDLFFIANKG